MQREIKFRAWIKADKRMEMCIDVNPFHVSDCDRLYWKHDEVELMQYTGLKDKNGKEIYEGDIVTEGVFNYVIKWIDFGFWKVQVGEKDIYKTLLYGIKNYIKVGNIHDNPELLQEGE